MSCAEETILNTTCTPEPLLQVSPKLPHYGTHEPPPECCQTCNYPFSDRADQVLHYKLDWHLYNVKQLLRGDGPITELDFSVQCEGDLSSLSGSDTEVEDDVTSTYIENSMELTSAILCRPYIAFQNGECFYKSLYSLLFSSELEITDSVLSETLRSCTVAESNVKLQFKGRVCVFLYSAQHFAGAVYEGESLLLHKTYHRYTVRAKQGTVQGIRDGKGNAPKSFGASLRRHNQEAMFNDIEQLLLDWADTLNGCHAIFHRTAVYNRNVFNKLKEKLGNKKHKFRTIPFTTYRPTLKETARVHKLLVKITKIVKKEFYDLKEAKDIKNTDILPSISLVQASNSKSIPNSHLKHRSTKHKKSETIAEFVIPDNQLKFFEISNNIYFQISEAIRNQYFDIFVSLLDSDTTINLDEKLGDGNSLLHLSAVLANPSFTKELLHRNLNPELRNNQSKTGYEAATSKEIRNEYRRFMAQYPDKWDYKVAKVPSPLTPEMEEAQENKKQEKKKAQRSAKAQQDKQKKAAKKEAERREKERVAGEVQQLRSRQLTARERCLLAAEVRLAAESGSRGCFSGKCDCCETGLDGLVPFERLHFKYCSVSCVREHKYSL